MLGDVFQNPFEILDDVPVFNPDHHETLCPKERLAGTISVRCALAIVRRPFEFNYQLLLRTVEVDDIGTNAMLTSELPALQGRPL